MNIRIPIYLTILCTLFISCAEFRLYRDAKFASGTYTQNRIDSIKKYLTSKIGSTLKDTIIIKYDFNNDGCWSALDDQSNEYIKRVIDGTKDYLSKYEKGHPNTSILKFKEKGNNFNKIKKWDKSILEDDGFLREKLFTKLASCGTSFKLYPDGKYEFVYSDSHFTILNQK